MPSSWSSGMNLLDAIRIFVSEPEVLRISATSITVFHGARSAWANCFSRTLAPPLGPRIPICCLEVRLGEA